MGKEKVYLGLDSRKHDERMGGRRGERETHTKRDRETEREKQVSS